MASELRLTGGFATAMGHLPHYFTPFQTYVVAEAERAEGRFDFRIGLEILEREAQYRAAGASPQGIFLYQFETLCRNRLGYDRGLEAIAGDEIYGDDWREWILTVRRQIGLIDFSDMIYVRSELYRQNPRRGREADPLRREGGPHRPGQPAEGPALPVCRLGAAPGLSERAAAAAGRHAALPSARLAAEGGSPGDAHQAAGRGVARRHQSRPLLRRPEERGPAAG